MNKLSLMIDQICMPNATAVKDEKQRQQIFRQNKKIVYQEIFIFVILILYILFTTRIPTRTQQIILTQLIAMSTITLSTCRSYPHIPKYVYFAVTVLFGPISLYYNADSIFFNWVSVFILPTWTLYLSGTKLFMIQLVIQITYLQVIYKHHLGDVLDYMAMEAFIRRLANISTFAVLVNSGLILGTQLALAKAQHEIATEKVQKMELEKQKVFLLSFSHELRNLINTMIGSVQLSMLEALPQKVRDLLHNSEVCGELLLHLVNNILDTGKVEIGELEINPTPNRVHETLEKVWGVYSQGIKTKGLQGKMRINTELPQLLKIDNYRLMQIMMNLIGNSIKSTENGGISIDVEWIKGKQQVTEECFEPIPFDNDNEGVFEKAQAIALLSKNLVELDLMRRKIKRDESPKNSCFEKGILKITVTDTGCGIPKDKISKLFTKFAQLSDDPSKRKLGTGLGLFITKQLIQRMGGEIKAFSQVGQGTAFIACIPAEPIQENQIQTLKKDEVLNLIKNSGLKAMIVDDTEFNLVVLASYLNKLGVQASSVARNGLEAVEKFKAAAKTNQAFDIVTMDVDMPIMDGKKAMRLIRAYEREHNLNPCLLIIVSGNCSESEIAECVHSGSSHVGRQTKADLFLKKPSSIDDLYNAIKSRFENGSWR